MMEEDETPEQESNSLETEQNEEEEDESASKKTILPSQISEAESGVIYLSRIPRFMNVKVLKEQLSRCGKIGRVFLQADGESRVCKKARIYKEGWVEFKEKKHAKRAAKLLNGQEVQSKHRSPWAGEVWNIKYLSRFRWRHLGESLEFEKAAHKMRLQAEYSKVKRTASFRLESIQKAETLKKVKDKRKKKVVASSDINFEGKGFYQKQTEEEVLKRKKAKLKEGETNRFEKKPFAGNQKGCSKIFSAAFSS
ncbi:activator of basal transcription 1 [Octopus sinensis]|uniref:Activator of basal transcription 1 n=1 Tax=Octopus sinensis TaxID=2607531 RepID=A0A6P7SSJ6_9MOLL|nr:activator of basal transcription 1 [Octopus sinensis]